VARSARPRVVKKCWRQGKEGSVLKEDKWTTSGPEGSLTGLGREWWKQTLVQDREISCSPARNHGLRAVGAEKDMITYIF
jgi:hypothetical protein